eukprot:gnl/TRDRNA2_/TRDRNA2_68855_c1_seq1.p1 gnl/TRDRNA2_/TRDRNA2_68855_c1~~gnl/TRDRNA2_/TRDRNA2_68855_c1_seq1.p1  ORF type:complete len:432 (+),score=60.36 gnl/TRDRNA2_/TRDRNA2_68855_c1_seq1:1-1296(+)
MWQEYFDGHWVAAKVHIVTQIGCESTRSLPAAPSKDKIALPIENGSSAADNVNFAASDDTQVAVTKTLGSEGPTPTELHPCDPRTGTKPPQVASGRDRTESLACAVRESPSSRNMEASQDVPQSTNGTCRPASPKRAPLALPAPLLPTSPGRSQPRESASVSDSRPAAETEARETTEFPQKLSIKPRGRAAVPRLHGRTGESTSANAAQVVEAPTPTRQRRMRLRPRPSTGGSETPTARFATGRAGARAAAAKSMGDGADTPRELLVKKDAQGLSMTRVGNSDKAKRSAEELHAHKLRKKERRQRRKEKMEAKIRDELSKEMSEKQKGAEQQAKWAAARANKRRPAWRTGLLVNPTEAGSAPPAGQSPAVPKADRMKPAEEGSQVTSCVSAPMPLELARPILAPIEAHSRKRPRWSRDTTNEWCASGASAG